MRIIPVLLPVLAGCGSGGPINVNGGDTGAPPTVPNILVDESALDFGQASALGELLSVQLPIQNTGEAELKVTGIDVTPPFDSSATTLMVQPNSSTQLGLFFIPTDYAEAAGTLTLVSNDPDEPEISIQLSGRVATDLDGDGYDRIDAGGDDCDDDDPSVHPGAEEIWYDDVDQDCAGDDDFDQDGDGYEADLYNPNASAGGGDCNDAVDWVYPGAPDEVYDGVDADCQGDSDWDADGDGFGSEALGHGSDCDDFDEGVYPGASERFNGKLDDCDGTTDSNMPASAADQWWSGDGADEMAGAGIAAGDVDGDGLADLFIGAPWYQGGGGGYGDGMVAVFLTTDGFPASGSDLRDGYNTFRGPSSSDGLGQAIVFMNDADGDGFGDVAFGSPGANGSAGSVAIVSAADLAYYGDTGDAHSTIEGDTTVGYYLGQGLARVDLDGDGIDDLYMETESSTSSNSKARLALVYGSEGGTGDISVSSADGYWSTDNDNGTMRDGLSPGRDLDGDGYEDIVYSDPLYDYSTTNDGAVWALFGSSEEVDERASIGSSSWQVVASSLKKYHWGGMFAATLPDLDGDARADLGFQVRETGYLYLLSGADLRSAVRGPDDAFAVLTLSSSTEPDRFAAIGDWDGDGADEWVMAFGSGAGGGQLYVFPGAGLHGEVDPSDVAIATFKGSSDEGSAALGTGVPAEPADLDGDGWSDLVMTDPEWSSDMDGDGTDDEDVGAVYVISNPEGL